MGCGRWGAYILRDLLQLGCEVTVADPSADRQTAAATAGAIQTVDSLLEITAADAVLIATPASLHTTSILEAIRLNCPIFVEKPMTTSSLDAREVLNMAGGRIFVMDKWRYHPGVEELSRIAESDEIGRPMALRTRRTQSSDTQVDVDAIWTLAPHDLAIADEILKTPLLPVSAIAERCSEGRVGMVGVLRAGDVPVVMDVSACRWRRERRVELECERGSAILASETEVVIQTVDGEVTRALPGMPPLFNELEAFVGFLNGGAPPRGTGWKALAAIEIIERLRDLANLDVQQKV